MNKSSVLKEIATELGVSITTVSRALRDCSDISEKTKEKVRKKAIELGYIQNTLSRLLDNEGKALIAVIIKSFENLYYTSFVQSFIDQSARSNYTYMVLPTDKYSVDVNVVKQCISQRVSFIITLCHISDKAIEYCQLNKIPICAAGFEPSHPYCSAVVPDYGRMVSLAANYLHEKCGVKDVVYCSKTEALSEINRYHLIRDEWMRICPEGQVTWLTMEQQDEIAGICARKPHAGHGPCLSADGGSDLPHDRKRRERSHQAPSRGRKRSHSRRSAHGIRAVPFGVRAEEHPFPRLPGGAFHRAPPSCF